MQSNFIYDSTLHFVHLAYHFTGKEHDAESGLDYFGARYYGSSMGRFLSPDWSDIPDSIPYADMDNPQSFNLYSYVRNNPLSATDPDGHDYYLQGGSQCGQNNIECDQQGYVLNAFGSRAVVTDQAVANGTYGANFDSNGNLSSITTGQGTFGAQFFDASPGAVSATVYGDEPISGFSQNFIQQTNAYNQAAMPLLNTMALNSAASLGITGVAEAAIGSGTTTLGAGDELGITSNQAINRMIGRSQRELLREFFKTGKFPEGLSQRTLNLYRTVAQRAIAAGKDQLGVQAQRIQMIDSVLR
jgi:RHS repeat-associated protein